MRGYTRGIPGGVFALCVFLSLAFHFVSFAPVMVAGLFEHPENVRKPQPVAIKVVRKSPKKDEQSTFVETDLKKRVVEVPLTPTEAPTESKYAGLTDHIAKKQTRLPKHIILPKTAEAGVRGKKKGSSVAPKKSEKKDLTLADFSRKPSARKLDNLVPTMNAGNPNAGYFDFIADTDVEIGDVLDINTTKTEFVGFFAHFRKSLQLVWVYPRAAAKKGLEGIVGLNIIFQKDGVPKSVSLRKSSGSKILDDAIIEAVWLAQPFGPLPASYKKETLTVPANFHYDLRVAH